VVAELPRPQFVRRAVAYGAAVYEESAAVEGIVAQLVPDGDDIDKALAEGSVPVVIDPTGDLRPTFRPAVVVDARMEKRPQDTSIGDAPLVIGLGPGFEAGVHCHAVVETNRGHYLGRVLWRGQAELDTGAPGDVGGVSTQRVLRAPADGLVRPLRAIGDTVLLGEIVAEVGGVPVLALNSGVLRGLIHPSVEVVAGMKIGDIDPRARYEHCFSISEKALAIGGGVLEAILASEAVRALLRSSERAGR
jgi:xanthine dehydrogenase accessory factor